MIFIDRINAAHPLPGLIESTNPCGEQPLLPFESCNLGSINLAKLVERGEMNWERLAELVSLAVRFLDDVIDMNRYPLQQIEETTLQSRKIGLGVMGFAEMLILMNISYNSPEAVRLAEEIMKFITQAAREASARLGEERGSFPLFEESRLKSWSAMRNATVTTIAPTGTISIIAGTSSGIEPLFALAFVRRVLEGARLLEVSPLFEDAAAARGIYTPELKAELARKGSAADMAGVPQDLKDLFVTALDIPPEQHVRIQAAFQKYTDNAVSKTVNLAESATVDDVLQVLQSGLRFRLQGRHRLSLRQQKPGALPGQRGDGGGVQALRVKIIRQIDLQRIAIAWKGGKGPRRQKVKEGDCIEKPPQATSHQQTNYPLLTVSVEATLALADFALRADR